MMIKKYCFKATLAAMLAMVVVMTAVGLYTTTKVIVAPYDAVAVQKASPAPESPAKAPDKPSVGWSVKEPSQTAEFISGPVAASVGELCVFRLHDPATRADWMIVPEATCYIDTSGSSLAFASNQSANYTVVAAIVEDGKPKILTHVCEYGASPQPDPDPTPEPNPPPNQTLKDWITINVPAAGRSQCTALAACYEATANAIDNGTILTQTAAYATIRTASQTKIDVGRWSEFLETLSAKLNTELAGSTDVKKLGLLFREIAEGLKAVVPNGVPAEPEVSAPDILPFSYPAMYEKERRIA